jgi:hypothetical protein
MRMPVRSFWMMNSNIGRVLAEKDLRAMNVGGACGSQDGFKELSKVLLKEMGDMFKTSDDSLNPMNAKRDEVGFLELKALASMM